MFKDGKRWVTNPKPNMNKAATSRLTHDKQLKRDAVALPEEGCKGAQFARDLRVSTLNPRDRRQPTGTGTAAASHTKLRSEA